MGQLRFSNIQKVRIHNYLLIDFYSKNYEQHYLYFYKIKYCRFKASGMKNKKENNKAIPGDLACPPS